MSVHLPVDAAAVIFDLDGTLYTLPHIGFHIALAMPFSARPLRNLFPVRDEMRGKDYGDVTRFKQAFADILGARCGLSSSRALSWYEERFMPCFIRVLHRRGRVRPGLVPLLSGLREKGIRLAVVSDFGRVEERLSALGIAPKMFDEARGAEELGVMKPTAKPFLSLLDTWRVSPSKAILVGDRADHDLGSARLAGTHFLGVENKRNNGPDFVSWQAATKLLDSLHFI